MADYVNGRPSVVRVASNYINGVLTSTDAVNYINGELVGGATPILSRTPRNLRGQKTGSFGGISFYIKFEWDHSEAGSPDAYQWRLDEGGSWNNHNADATEITIFVRGVDHIWFLRGVWGTELSDIASLPQSEWILDSGGNGEMSEEPFRMVLVDSAGTLLTDFHGNVLERG